MKKLTHEEFIQKLPAGTNYTFVSEYKSNRESILIKDKYGVCSSKPSNLLRGFKSSIITALDKTDYFINQAKETHGNKYEYNKVVYQGFNKKVVITCKVHGDFSQTPNCHIFKKGCYKCSLYGRGGWTREDFVTRAKKKECTLYLIKCFSDKETFVKIGITSNSVEERFNTLPYTYTILKEIKSFDSAYIWNLEKRLHRRYRHLSYFPQIPFKGDTECFKY